MTPQLRTRAAAFVALAGAALLSLTACGGTATAGSSTYGTASAGVLKMAFRADDKPVSFVQNGQPTGFMIDLTTAMAQELKLKPEYVSLNFNSMLPDVRNHQYDLAAFGTLVTPARQQQTAFTSAVSYSQAQIISAKQAAINDVDGCNGKTIAITQGSELIPLLQKLAPKTTIKQFPSVASSANALVAGQVDGLLTGVATTTNLLAQHADFTAAPPITSGESAFPVAKDKTALQKALNTALKDVIDDGTYTKLFVKWNPPGTQIPEQMLRDYPGLKQVPASGSSGS